MRSIFHRAFSCAEDTVPWLVTNCKGVIENNLYFRNGIAELWGERCFSSAKALQPAQEFNVKAIPHTFTIDADGVLQDEHIGDASLTGKLKKLCAQARQTQEAPKTAAAVAGN